MFPLNRNRRLRSKSSLRNLVRESSLSPNDFIVPLFICEGEKIKEEIKSMPEYYRLSLDNKKRSKGIVGYWSAGHFIVC